MKSKAAIRNEMTGNFAAYIDDIIAQRFAEHGISNHNVAVERATIAVERANEGSLYLVRLATSNECRKHVTLALSTPNNLPSIETARFNELLRSRGDADSRSTVSEVVEPANGDDWEQDLDRYIARSIRAHLRQKAIIAHPEATESSSWTNTVHPLVKTWLEHNGNNLAKETVLAYNNNLSKKGNVGIGRWYFIDGYATCEAVSNREGNIHLYGNMGSREVTLLIRQSMPDSVLLGLKGKPLGALAIDGFLQPHSDLKIIDAGVQMTKDGIPSVHIKIEAAEVLMGTPPKDFDTAWIHIGAGK